MRYGLDYLGGAKFGDVLVREHPEGWAAGFFANTFGNAWPVIDRLLATGRCPVIRIQATWTDHVYNPSRHDPIILKELSQANAIKAKYPRVEVQFSPLCEHREKIARLKPMMAKVKAAAKNLTLINCPETGKGEFSSDPNWLNECHNALRKPPRGPYQFSFDGTSSVDSDIEAYKAYHAGCNVFFLWVPQFNLKMKVIEKPPIPIPQRKAIPTGQLIDSLIYLHRSRSDTSVSDKHIWKSHCEQTKAPTPGPRDLKPVFICPERANRIELVAGNGQVVAVSGPGSSFSGGGYRYYFSEFGYQIAEKAVRIHGVPTLTIKANGQVLGIVNPAFRAGNFR